MLPLSKCESYRILNIDKSQDELNHDKCEPSAMALADSKFFKHNRSKPTQSRCLLHPPQSPLKLPQNPNNHLEALAVFTGISAFLAPTLTLLIENDGVCTPRGNQPAFGTL